MADSQDFMVLEWVAEELKQTLVQAKSALEAYANATDDTDILQNCLAHVHQIRGTLQMVQFHGAALLAAEIELLAEQMTVAGANERFRNDASEVLLASFDKLPLYFSKVVEAKKDFPAVVLGMVNDIRAVRGHALLSETVLFGVQGSAKSTDSERVEISEAELHQISSKLRQMYQVALLGFIRGQDTSKNLNYLAKVSARLVKITAGRPQQALWKVSIALLEGLLNKSISANASVKILLRQLDRELKSLVEQTGVALDKQPPEDVLKNMLYYVAQSGANSRFITEIKQDYGFELPVLGEDDLSSQKLEGPSDKAMQQIVEGLRSQADALLQLLESGFSSHVAQVATEYKQIFDTVAILGFIEDISSFAAVSRELSKASAQEGAQPSETLFTKLRASIQQLSYQPIHAEPEPLFNDSEEAQQHLDDAFVSVCREARNGLEKTKESIIEYVATQWNPECLAEVPETLVQISGGMAMVPLSRAAKIVLSCEHYVREVILASGKVPAWQTLDILADAVTSIDYYLERLLEDPKADNDTILSVAEESVGKLFAGEAGGAEESLAGEDTVLHEDAEQQTVADVIDAFPEESTDDEQQSESATIIPLNVDRRSEDLDVEEQELSQSAELEIEEQAVPEPVGAEFDVTAEEPAESTVEVEPEPAMAVSVPIDAGSVQLEDAEEIDDEIAEIFVEEAEEVLETIDEYYPQWLEDLTHEENFVTIRRSFHTLKGSGRMAGALVIGEFAWAVENMLNKVIDGAFTIDKARADIVADAKAIIPGMVKAFEQREMLQTDLANALIVLTARAEQLQTQQDVSVEEAPELVEQAVDMASDSAALAEVSDSVLDESDADVSSDIEVAEVDSDVADVEQDSAADEEALGLQNVFVIETRTHLDSIAEFLAQDRSAADVTTPSDNLQRALHTLKGSSRMAGFTELSDLVAPVEELVREVRLANIAADDHVYKIIEDLHGLVEADIAGIEGHSSVEGEDRGLFVERVQVELQRIGESAAEENRGSGVVSEFLASALQDLLGVSDAIDEHLSNDSSGVSSDEREQWLSVVAQQRDKAVEISQQEFSSIASPLINVLQDSLVVVPGTEVGEEFLKLMSEGAAGLLDVLDCLAADQLPTVSAALIESLESHQFSAALSDDEVESIIENNTDAAEVDFNESIVEDEADELEAIVDNEQQDADETSSVELDLLSSEVVVDESNSSAEGSESKSLQDDDSGFIYAVVGDESEEEVSVDGSVAEEIDGSIGIEDSSNDSVNDLDTIEVSSDDTSPGRVSSEDEEIDAEILEIFLEEAADILESIDQTIHDWSEDLQNPELLTTLQRDLHTLKGGARLAGLKALGDFSHEFESVLIEREEQKLEVTQEFFSQMQGVQDQLVVLVDAAVKGDFGNSAAEEAGKNDVLTGEVISFDAASNKAEDVSSTEPPTKPRKILSFGGGGSESPTYNTNAVGSGANLAVEPSVVLPAVAASATKKAPQEMVKVSSELLEELVNLAGETSISRGRVEEQVNDFGYTLEEMQITVDRLMEQVRRLDQETEAQILFRQEQVESEGLENFDPLEMDRYSQLQHLSRALLESSSDLKDVRTSLVEKSRDIETLLGQQSRINTELQEGLMRSRMVPFNRVLPRLRRIVRQISDELEKDILFAADNTEGELDRSVLERLVPPLEHMLRNAIDHGIEPPKQRSKSGKSKSGSINLTMAREGGEVVVTLSDDGCGVDVDAVKAKAIERGMMSADSSLAEEEILQFILQSGFSTAQEVTQISGRGVGMDVVSSEIKQLGGTIDIQSVRGAGTKFIVRLPFTVSVNRALMIESGDDTYAIPLNTIEGIVRITPFELDAYYQPDAPAFEYAGEPYSLRYVGELLGNRAKPQLSNDAMPLPVLLVRGKEQSVAVQVDHLLGSREVVVKPLGPQFSAVQGLTGATILGDGNVVVILDLMAMVRATQTIAYKELQDSDIPTAVKEVNPLVMVVDDSVTVRKVTSRFLEREGYDVLLAKDGLDAVTQLQAVQRIPDLMLLDIEMPRMDGFEVASRIRHDSKLNQLPIIMITSRTGEKHRQRAMSLGVNDYLGKPYQEAELLELIQQHTSKVVTH